MSTKEDMLLTLGLDKASIQKLKRDYQKVLKDTEGLVDRVSKKETSSASKRLSLLRAELAHQKALNKARQAGVGKDQLDKATSEFKGGDVTSLRAKTLLINDLAAKRNQLTSENVSKLKERNAVESKWVSLRKKAQANIDKMDAKSAVEVRKAERLKLALFKERTRQEGRVHAEALREYAARERDANRKKWTQSRVLGTLAIGGMAAGAVGGTVSHIARINSEFQSLEASFGGMFGAEKANELKYVNQTANKFGNDLFDLARSYMNLKAATDGVKMSQQDLRGLFEGFQKVAAISGSTNEEMRLSLRGLVQSLGAGKLQMQEFYQMVESIPLLRSVLEETLGNPKDINKLIGSGKVITKEILPDLIKNLNAKFSDEDISKALNTIGRNTTRFVNLWKMSMKALGEGGFNEAVTDSMSDFSSLLEENQSMFYELGKVIGSVITVVTKLVTLYGGKLANAVEMLSVIINQAIEGFTEIKKALDSIGDASGVTAAMLGPVGMVLGSVGDASEVAATGLGVMGDVVLWMLGPIGRLIVALEYLYDLYQDIMYSFDENPLTLGSMSKYGDVKGDLEGKVYNMLSNEVFGGVDITKSPNFEAIPQNLMNSMSNLFGGGDIFNSVPNFLPRVGDNTPSQTTINITTGNIETNDPSDFMSQLANYGNMGSFVPN